LGIGEFLGANIGSHATAGISTSAAFMPVAGNWPGREDRTDNR
jgi:hypothetical protein